MDSIVLEIDKEDDSNSYISKNSEIDIGNFDSIIKSYFDPNNSFYKVYHEDVYNNLVNIDNIDKLSQVITSNEFCLTEKYLITYLKKNKIYFDKKDINAIPNIINNQFIPNFLEGTKDKILNIGVALALEKYYLDCQHTIERCPEYPPKFPKPIFDPCEYPNILTLYNHFNNYCHDQRQLHSLSGDYFNMLNKKFLVPSIFLACFGSVFSFISTMCFLSEYQRDIMSIFVGITSCLVALLQSLISAYQFDTKSSHHYRCADLYDQLLTSIDFEKNYPNNPNFFHDLEKDIIKIKSNCPFLVPAFIKKKYYNKKDKQDFDSFIKKNIIKPSRKEIIESIQTGNKSMNLNDNLEFYKKKIEDMQTVEKSLLNIEDKSLIIR